MSHRPDPAHRLQMWKYMGEDALECILVDVAEHTGDQSS